MGFVEKFLNSIRLDDSFDDDEFLDEEDEEDEYFDDVKPKGHGFSGFFRKDEDLDDDATLDDYDEPDSSSPYGSLHMDDYSTFDEDDKPKRKERVKKKSKITPVKKRGGDRLKVNVIRPKSFEDTQEVADTLIEGCAVVINLEGLDYMLAQRVVDFTCGTCYALDGHVQQASRTLLILTPADVDITGDAESILDGNFDIPNMSSSY
ncbi:MAG: cell division protein SepF [Lachnospiraceae bacterium]|nr:cell division protein SepF [Lachnospiraceae bacterium]